MNRFVTIMISVFLLQTIFSCSHKSDTKLYTKNAILVIEKILSEEYPCDCLIIKSSEEGLANTERRISIEEQERLIMSELDFYSKKEFLSAIALSESFELDTLSNYPKIKILKSKTLDSIYKKADKDFQNGKGYQQLDCLKSVCPIMITVYKPIFNSNFTKVMFYTHNNYSCLQFPFGGLKFTDGNWN